MRKVALKYVFRIASFFVILVSISNMQAQEYYRTMSATMIIKGLWNDSAIVAKSNRVFLLLNYETAEFLMQLDKSTLRTGIDSLDRLLASREYDYIEYEGKLGIEYINTQKHPPQDFEVEDYLRCMPHSEKKIIGKGRLEYIFGDPYSCILKMHFFHLNLRELGLDIPLPGLKDEVNVEIIQTVLKRVNE